MPRKPIIRSSEHFYHLTGRSNNKDFWYLSIAEVWDIMCDELNQLQLAYKVEIANFVLMNNHFHLILKTPKVDIDKIMYEFMKHTTLKIQKSSGRINKVYGGRYKGCILLDRSYFFNAYKYVYLNPVRASIVKCPIDYPFSTLKYKVRNKKLKHLKFAQNPLGLSLVEEVKWIKDFFDQKENENIRYGLSRSQFSWRKCRNSGRELKIG